MGLNWRLLAHIVVGWVVTLIIVAATSAGLFSFCAFAPSIQQTSQLDLWRGWAGGFVEGVRQAAVVARADGVTVGAPGIRLCPNPCVGVRDDAWDDILPNQLEMLTNLDSGIQTQRFDLWSDFKS